MYNEIMRLKQKTSEEIAQEIQDNIFRSMPADKKVDVGSQLWRLAKELVGNKINYGTNRPEASVDKSR